jgi:hypothetical protein
MARDAALFSQRLVVRDRRSVAVRVPPILRPAPIASSSVASRQTRTTSKPVRGSEAGTGAGVLGGEVWGAEWSGSATGGFGVSREIAATAVPAGASRAMMDRRTAAGRIRMCATL